MIINGLNTVKKKSTYMLTPKHTLEVHDNDSLDNDPRVLNTDIKLKL